MPHARIAVKSATGCEEALAIKLAKLWVTQAPAAGRAAVAVKTSCHLPLPSIFF
jgi:hypothetical protein